VRLLAACILLVAAVISTGALSAKMTFGWFGQLKSHIDACWQRPSGITNDDAIEARILVVLNPDGTLNRKPELVDVTMHPLSKAFVESAFAAIEHCQPYSFLPADEYKDGWDKLDMTFSTDAAMRSPSRLKPKAGSFSSKKVEKLLHERTKRDPEN
jgi:hypothetical protein